MLKSKTVNNIRDLAAQGYSIRRIADETGLERNTVRKYLRGSPEPAPRPKRVSKLGWQLAAYPGDTVDLLALRRYNRTCKPPLAKPSAGPCPGRPYPTADNEWMDPVVPHIGLIVPDPQALAELPTDPDHGGPSVMFRGTPYVHVMIPVPRYVREDP